MTTSGKSKASSSAASAAPRSASSPRLPWHRYRPTAPQRTSSSPARHLTPAPPTVPPVPPVLPNNTPPPLQHLTSLHVYIWLADTQGKQVPFPLNFQSVNLFCITTSDLNHRLTASLKCCHTEPDAQSTQEVTPCNMNSRGQRQHAQETLKGQFKKKTKKRSLHFIYKLGGNENCAFCSVFLKKKILFDVYRLHLNRQGVLGVGEGLSFAKTTSAFSWVLHFLDLFGHLSPTIPANWADKHFVVTSLCHFIFVAVFDHTRLTFAANV